MPFEKIGCGNGQTMKVISHNGLYWSPQFSEEAMINMKDFPLREDDVILCSYAKSGCHWVWETIRLLVAGDVNSDEVVDKELFMMEWRPYQQYDSLPSPRVLNNHMPFELMPKDLLVKKPKVVFFYRNFKDVAVSFYYHHKGISEYEYNGDFQDHLQMLVSGKVDNGSPFEYIRSWERGLAENPDLPVFVGSYENLKENNMSEVKRLSRFLGKNHSDDFLAQVCAITNFEKMKQTKGEKSFKNKDGEPVMYRKGQVGDWRNHFTVATNEWFDEVIKKETASSRLKFTYIL